LGPRFYPNPIESNNLSILVDMELKIVYPNPIESNNLSILVHMRAPHWSADLVQSTLGFVFFIVVPRVMRQCANGELLAPMGN
jgi:hypothetical protein